MKGHTNHEASIVLKSTLSLPNLDSIRKPRHQWTQSKTHSPSLCNFINADLKLHSYTKERFLKKANKLFTIKPASLLLIHWSSFLLNSPSTASPFLLLPCTSRTSPEITSEKNTRDITPSISLLRTQVLWKHPISNPRSEIPRQSQFPPRKPRLHLPTT